MLVYHCSRGGEMSDSGWSWINGYAPLDPCEEIRRKRSEDMATVVTEGPYRFIFVSER